MTRTNRKPAAPRTQAAINRDNDRKFWALLLILIVVAWTAMAGPGTNLGTGPGSTAPVDVAKVRCSTFTAFEDASWTTAQAHYDTDYANTSDSAALLDGDRDGYACEVLTKNTPAEGEPGCYRPLRTLWTKDCSARTQYRAITHLTTKQDPHAIRSALLDVYVPYAVNSEVVKDALVEALTCASSESTAEMQRFIRVEHTRDETVQAFTATLGLGNKVLDTKALKGTYAQVVDAYLDMASEVAVWSTDIKMSDVARTSLVAAYTGGTCAGSRVV